VKEKTRVSSASIAAGALMGAHYVAAQMLRQT